MKKDIEFPDCWEELKPIEWAELLSIIHKSRKATATKVTFTMDDFNRHMAWFILKKRGQKLSTRKDEDLLLIDEAAKSLSWMWRKEDDGTMELTFDSTVNLFPKYRHLIGPKDHGANLTFGEFRQAIIFANAYTRERKPQFLDALTGILYRKADNRGHRSAFIQEDIEEYARNGLKVPASMKWGIYVWFTSFIKFLMDGTFIIDGQEVCFAPVFGTGGGSDDSSLGLNSILFSVAESGVFGNMTDTDNTLLLHVLMKLLDDHNKAEAIKKSIKK